MQEEDPTAVEPDEPNDEKRGRGHDPDKTTGRARAEEVHARNEERQRMRDEELPEKPDEEQLPEEGDITGDELDEIQKAGAEDVDFLDEDKAQADDTIDTGEQPEQPHSDLPEGATSADYDEKEDTQDGLAR